jgi:ABC-type lipopolysaccharide export system ATPase subunit
LIDGQLVAQGSPQEVVANQVVRERYLGQTFSLNKESVRA